MRTIGIDTRWRHPRAPLCTSHYPIVRGAAVALAGHSLLFQMFFSHILHMYTHTEYKMYRPRKFKYS
jgi:hypothetical protein